jgi:heptosyltransferase-2
MRILAVCPNWVGDAVMATPALRALRRHFASAQIIGLMRPVIGDTLDGLPYFDRRIIWKPRGSRRPERTWAVTRLLRREPIDVAVLFTNSLRTALVAWFSGAKRRVGYRRDGRGWLLTDRLEAPRHGRRYQPTPIVDYYLDLAYHLGCPRETRRLELRTSAGDEALAETVWRREQLTGASRVVVLSPGGAFGPAKAWPAAHFGELARRLVAERGTHVLVLCGPAERDAAREIVKFADRPRVHSLADYDVSIGLSKACVRRADLMVATDSGPRHFAAAFDVPVVTLFGPTHIAWSETYFLRAVHLQKKVPCGPCQLPECPLDHRCMRDLSPAEVHRTVVELLAREPPGPVVERRSA